MTASDITCFVVGGVIFGAVLAHWIIRRSGQRRGVDR